MIINGETLSSTTMKNNVNNVKRTFTSSKEEERYTFNVNCYNKAKYLVEKFERLGYDDAKNCYNYFAKCFSVLSENVIWELFESAVNNPKIKSAIKYFIAACRNQMAQVNI